MGSQISSPSDTPRAAAAASYYPPTWPEAAPHASAPPASAPPYPALPAATAAAWAPTPAPPRARAQERHIDVELVIDDSGSMAGARWEEVREGVQALLLAALEHDRNGVEVSFLNHDPDPYDDSPHSVLCVRSRAEIARLFDDVQPMGRTPTAEALQRVLARFWSHEGGNGPRSVAVVTDGAPDSPQQLREVVAEAARRLDALGAPAGHLGFSFIGIGVTPGSAAYRELQWLDDALPRHYGVRDIVDCSNLADDRTPLRQRLPKLLFGGVDAALDARRGL